MTQVVYQTNGGLILAAGEFPTAPSTPGLAVIVLPDAEVVKLRQPGEKRVGSDGTVTVTPPAPPAPTRPKNLGELATDYGTAKGNYQTGTTAVGAANNQWTAAANAAQQIAALRAGMVAQNQQITALAAAVDTLAKALAVLANDAVPNT